jgi:hypothetical protein
MCNASTRAASKYWMSPVSRLHPSPPSLSSVVLVSGANTGSRPGLPVPSATTEEGGIFNCVAASQDATLILCWVVPLA